MREVIDLIGAHTCQGPQQHAELAAGTIRWPQHTSASPSLTLFFPSS